MKTKQTKAPLSPKDVERFSVLTHPDYNEIYRLTGVSQSTSRCILKGERNASTPKGLIVLKEAEKMLKNRK